MTVIATKTLASLLLPPGVFILIGMAAWWWRRRRPRLATGLLVADAMALWVLSLPVTGFSLLLPLQADVALNAAAIPPAGAIVVPGAGRYPAAPEYGGVDTVSGAALERLRYAARLHRRSALPILVAGGSVYGGRRAEATLMAESLREDFGVHVRWVAGRSRNTGEDARGAAALLAEAGVSRILLVTHAWHMPRARAAFERAGLEVVAAPTMFMTRSEAADTLLYYMPSAVGLAMSARALHEYLGRAWYALRAWVL